MSARRPRSMPTEPVPVEDPGQVLLRARRRVDWLGVPLTIALLAVGVRGGLRILSPDEDTREMASAHRWIRDVRTGPRGDIVAADGSLLATSVRTPSLTLDPSTFRRNLRKQVRARLRRSLGRTPTADEVAAETGRRLRGIAEELAEALDRPVHAMHAALHDTGNYHALARDVHPAVARQLQRRGLASLGIRVDDTYKRYYPQGTLAGQLLGFVNHAGHGVQGVERFHDDALRGREIVVQRPKGAWLEGEAPPAEDPSSLRGASIRLTIDPAVQRAAEHALRAAVERHGAQRAAAAVVEVKTGRVLALANAPVFDPNRFDGDFVRSENFAVSGAVEPGSVFKPLTYALALDAGVVRSTDLIDTTSPWPLYGHRIHDTHPRPFVTAAEMVKVSSNIAAGKLAQKIGPERMLAGLSALGIGSRTGIETSGERAGKRHPPSGMGPVELVTVSFGHGATATPLQLASAVAALGHGGERLRPWLIEEVRDTSGVVRRGQPVTTGRVVSERAAALALDAMESVTEDGGTGTRARVDGYRVAGKTGTAEKPTAEGYSRSAHFATFVGLGPLPDPELAVAVLVDEPTREGTMGGSVAAPVFAEIMTVALPARGVAPTEPVDAPEGPAVEASEPPPGPRGPVRTLWVGEGWSMPDLSGRSLREALAGLQGTGVQLEIDGAGLVVAQRPSPGTPVRPGGRVRLVLSRGG